MKIQRLKRRESIFIETADAYSVYIDNSIEGELIVNVYNGEDAEEGETHEPIKTIIINKTLEQ